MHGEGVQNIIFIVNFFKKIFSFYILSMPMYNIEEKKIKVVNRLNMTLRNTLWILKNINKKIETTVDLNTDIIRTINVYKIWKEKM
jgi:hypothetical protein